MIGNTIMGHFLQGKELFQGELAYEQEGNFQRTKVLLIIGPKLISTEISYHYNHIISFAPSIPFFFKFLLQNLDLLR